MDVGSPALVVIGVFLAYTAIVGVMWKVARIDYRTLSDSRSNVMRGIVLPIGAGATFLAIAVTVLGAWDGAMVDDTDLAPGWVIAVPIVLGVVAVLNVLHIDFRASKDVLPALALGVVLVGFAEEMVTRGVMIVGFREQGWSELTVYLVCTALFGLLHGLNAFFGQSTAATVQQIVFAFVAGTGFYVTRMATGSLLVGMVIHALWDFGALGQANSKRTQRPAVAALALAGYVLSMVAVWFVVV